MTSTSLPTTPSQLPVALVPTKGTGSKYRNLVRGLAVNSFGWELTQGPKASVDRFTKGGTTIDVHHGPKDLVTMVEMVTSEGSYDQVPPKAGSKLNILHSWLSGQPVNLAPHLLMKAQELALHDWLQAESLHNQVTSWLQAEATWAWLQAEKAYQQATQAKAPAPKPRATRATKAKASQA